MRNLTKVKSMVQHLTEACLAQGWTVEYTGGKRIRFVSPTGLIVSTSHTPRDQRGVDYLRAMLQRTGLKI